MTIAVDFDGTIVEDRYPKIGKPVPYAFETLISLQKKGHKVILWTVREGELLQAAVDFCRDNGLEFFSVNSESPIDWGAGSAGSGAAAPRRASFTPRKLRADIYIDDRGVAGLPDWATIEKIVCGEKPAGEDPGEVRQGWHHHSHSSSSSRGSRSSGRSHSGRSHKRNFFQRIADRCRRSRERFG